MSHSRGTRNRTETDNSQGNTQSQRVTPVRHSSSTSHISKLILSPKNGSHSPELFIPQSEIRPAQRPKRSKAKVAPTDSVIALTEFHLDQKKKQRKNSEQKEASSSTATSTPISVFKSPGNGYNARKNASEAAIRRQEQGTKKEGSAFSYYKKR
jgi:hypothetical protein